MFPRRLASQSTVTAAESSTKRTAGYAFTPALDASLPACTGAIVGECRCQRMRGVDTGEHGLLWRSASISRHLRAPFRVLENTVG